MPKYTVAIIGAGLSGLLFAIALQKYAPDVEIQIFESAPELADIGAGIGFQPRTWYVVRQLGLEDALLKVAGNGQKSNVVLINRKADQRDGFTLNESVLDGEVYTFHRGQLHKVLLDHIQDSSRVHVGKRFVSYVMPTDPNGQITVIFKDGSTTTCDVLIGADGLKSSVRSALFIQLADAAQAAGRADEAEYLRSCIPPKWLGVVAYRTLIKRDSGDGTFQRRATWMDHLVMYCGKSKHIVAYPVASGRTLNFAAVTATPQMQDAPYEGPWVAKVSKDEAIAAFSGWEPEVEDIMKASDESGWSKWALHVVKDLPTFVSGRVALLGDAAHAMPPFQGAGAGQGFEDALLLGQVLGHPKVNRDTVSTALEVYDEFRRPFAQKVAALSLRSGQLHSLTAPEIFKVTAEDSSSGKAPTKEQLKKLAEVIEQVKEWRDGTTVEQDCIAALQNVEELLA